MKYIFFFSFMWRNEVKKSEKETKFVEIEKFQIEFLNFADDCILGMKPLVKKCKLNQMIKYNYRLNLQWSISPRLSHWVVFNLTFFKILELLLSKWKFHDSSSNMISKHDLMPNWWSINNLLMFCGPDNRSCHKNVEILNYSSIWYQIMVTDHNRRRMVKFSFW